MGHVNKCLAVLLAIVTYCGCAEFYVKPTGPANAHCPGLPCFTLNYYTTNSSIYFVSNSTFIFLSGSHCASKTVLFQDVDNVSLVSYSSGPEIEVYLIFNCSVSDAGANTDAGDVPLSGSESSPPLVSFENVSGVVIRGISVSVKVPGASGLVLNETTSAYLERTSFSCDPKYPGNGLVLYYADSTTLNITRAANCSSGVLLLNSANVFVLNLTAVYNRRSGVLIESTTNASLTNIASTENGEVGIAVEKSHNTSITNADCSHAGWDGVAVMSSSVTFLDNITACHNGVFGAYISISNVTTLTNSIFAYASKLHGIYLEESQYVTISNVVATHSNISGIRLWRAKHITIIGSFFVQNFNGIDAYYSNNISISYTLIQNGSTLLPHWSGSGLSTQSCNNLTISHCTVLNSQLYGVTISGGNSVTIENTVVRYSGYSGIMLSENTNNVLRNVTALYSNMDIALMNCFQSHILSATVTSSQLSRGLTLFSSNHTLIENVTILQSTTFEEPVLNVLYLFLESILIVKCTNVTLSTVNLAAPWRGVSVYETSQLSIRGCRFVDMKPLTFASDPTSLPSIILLYSSSVILSNSSFLNNEISSVKLFGSNLTLTGELNFTNNTAPSGTAFIMSKDSIVKLSKNSHTTFTNNHATGTGGVFYIATDTHYIVEYVDNRATVVVLGTVCFIEVEDGKVQDLLTFTNNTAGYGGDLIYGGNVANGWDRDMNCLLRFQSVSRVYPPYNDLSLITSTPSRVCLCNGTGGVPNCSNVLDYEAFSVYPGQTILVAAVVTGQNFGTVAGSVYAQFLRQSPAHVAPVLDFWQYTQGVVQYTCNSLNFTVYSSARNGSSEVLVLTVDAGVVSTVPDRERVRQTFELWRSTFFNKSERDDGVFTSEIFEYPVYINVTVLPCPLGFQLTEEEPGVCGCGSLLRTLSAVECDIQQQMIVRSGHVWVGVMEERDQNSTAVSRFCPRGYCRSERWGVSLDNPDTQCTFRRAGTLCGGCGPGLSLTLGGSHCEPCSNMYLLLLLPFSLAGVALVFFIKTFDLTVSKGSINALILYANIIQANKYFLLGDTITPFTVFIAWLNLDVGVNTCFFNGMTVYYNAWLQFVFPVYIWTIAGAIILLAKYSNRAAALMGNNSVPVLATLFLLSYSKLLQAIITALSFTTVHTPHSSKAVWAADGNLDYLGPRHATLFAVATAALLFLWLPYTLLLFLGQWLQRSHNRLLAKLLMNLKPFMDAHYAPFKGHHRYWFGALLLVRVLVLLMSAFSPADSSGVTAYGISVLSILLTYFGLVVYRSTAVMMFEASFFVNLGITAQTGLLTQVYSSREGIGASVLIGIAMAQFLGLVVYKAWGGLTPRLEKRLGVSLRKRVSSVAVGEVGWENWELSQAALLKDVQATIYRSNEREALLPSGGVEPAGYGSQQQDT